VVSQIDENVKVVPDETPTTLSKAELVEQAAISSRCSQSLLGRVI
jgi:hypothetical protein